MMNNTGRRGERVFIRTFGCQMNMYDSQFISSALQEIGFIEVDDAQEADIIIVNGCSIRKHAEDRAINWIHRYSRLDNKRIAVIGCLAQNLHDQLREKVEGIDIICGPDNYNELVDIISGSSREMNLPGRKTDVTYSLTDSYRPDRFSGFVSITRGCENFCSYCVVPYLRGKLRSKDPSAVISEILHLEEKGCREITLLGQNVLAYKHGDTGFTELLEMILRESPVERIRFLTSHPRDVRTGLFRIMRDNTRVCPHIHLPLQAGSDRILKLMKRGYSSGEYLRLLEKARDILPGLAVTTDIIVGFPSETEDDFSMTMEAVRSSRFDSAFTFIYSPREGTAAWRFPDEVPLEIKKQRLQRLNQLVMEIRLDILREQIGKRIKILLDGTAQRGENLYFKGRTPHFRNVLLDCGEVKEGDIVEVTLEKLEKFTFIGKCRR
ncbi:MAG: tRNA (N6-isopentenyl adenosine(37)-C2)-methylthiotransferase MiaB [Candidatus Latescibacteria bacterium]|nr:tRNA (N6-isopentenyl adenosine(37)-C2)-methylthiotransferase MiaB [bacterium]MBD3423328.1 tRNA (N6-isopentenyl adenosine(37)-C2)-methylthiotransferase MiaB [Candidatus Latescibacterota bacterium]